MKLIWQSASDLMKESKCSSQTLLWNEPAVEPKRILQKRRNNPRPPGRVGMNATTPTTMWASVLVLVLVLLGEQVQI